MYYGTYYPAQAVFRKRERKKNTRYTDSQDKEPSTCDITDIKAYRLQGLEYSLEYQFRLDDNMSSLSNHFVEFMGYHKASENLLLNGGYRFTKRRDHDESRL